MYIIHLLYFIVRKVYDMLTMKDIIRDGHPTLRAKAEDVSLPLSDEDKNTLKKCVNFN